MHQHAGGLGPIRPDTRPCRSGADAIERANAAGGAIARLAQVVGPLLAGGLIVLLGAANVLFVDAATFVASAALVAIGVPSAVSARVAAEATGKAGYLRELLDGLRFVRWNALVLPIFLSRR